MALGAGVVTNPSEVRAESTPRRGADSVLPLDPALAGSEVHTQVLLLDAPANQAGVVSSNGLTTRIGG